MARHGWTWILGVGMLLACGAAAAEPLRLYGVVLGSGGGGIAYLGDPETGRVHGFRVGDAVGNRELVAIQADRVVLRGDGETVEIRLSGVPASPRAPAGAAGAAPGAAASPLCPPFCPTPPTQGEAASPAPPASLPCPPFCPAPGSSPASPTESEPPAASPAPQPGGTPPGLPCPPFCVTPRP